MNSILGGIILLLVIGNIWLGCALIIEKIFHIELERQFPLLWRYGISRPFKTIKQFILLKVRG